MGRHERIKNMLWTTLLLLSPHCGFTLIGSEGHPLENIASNGHDAQFAISPFVLSPLGLMLGLFTGASRHPAILICTLAGILLAAV